MKKMENNTKKRKLRTAKAKKRIMKVGKQYQENTIQKTKKKTMIINERNNKKKIVKR